MELKMFRKAQGLTQEQVAAALGIPTKTYQNYEREVREADSDILCALADLYGITIDELVGRGCPVAVTDDDNESEHDFMSRYRSLNDEGKRVLSAIAETLATIYPAKIDG